LATDRVPIPLCVPEIRGNEWAYVKECLDTGWVSSVGSYVQRFEDGLAESTGNSYGVATASGTSALHVALRVAGIEPDDEILVSTLTFIAPVNAIRYMGAWPLFVDADPDYWQMDPAKVETFLVNSCRSENGRLVDKRTSRRVAAVIPVHILGHPCPMDAIVGLARRFGLTIIEDATESLGALHRGHPVGHLGDIACLSFNGNKLLTTGGGGAIVTDKQEWAERARYLTTQAKDDTIEYVHGEIGYNYRLTNVQAAIGCGQLEQLSAYLAAKRTIASRYAEALADVPGITPMPEARWATSAFWMYTVRVDPKAYGRDSRALLRALDQQRIQTRPLWQPIHLSKAHPSSYEIDCSTAEMLYEEALSLPCSVGLTELEQARVIELVRELSGTV
jgi:perosamine synthetase